MKPRKGSVGKTASSSVGRKVSLVSQYIKEGRTHTPTFKACLEGNDGAAVRHGVWRRALTDPRLAMFLNDEWKRVALHYEASTHDKVWRAPMPNHEIKT